jgi:glycogen(starch) synthase
MSPRTVLMTADAVGGVWRYVVDLGTALTGRGMRVVVAVMGPPPSPEDRRDADRAGLVVITRPYRLEWMENPWTDVERAGQWLLTLERMVKPDIVHLNGYVHASLDWSRPVVVVAHSCVRSWWRAVKRSAAPADLDRYTGAVKAGLAAADVVVTPSAAMSAALESEYGVALAPTVIPNGRAPEQMNAPSAKEPFVFAAGRVWDEGKNIASLCAIASVLPWPVYVAGDTHAPDGTRSDELPARMLGRLPAAELAGWYRRAAIYALPARYEPFGLSVLEAASAGCALVLGDIDSLREHWDGAAAFVAPDDCGALQSAIESLASDADARLAAGRNAADRALAFTIERTANSYLRIYDRLTT